jgi:hypothetical protein
MVQRLEHHPIIAGSAVFQYVIQAETNQMSRLNLGSWHRFRDSISDQPKLYQRTI